MHVNCLLATQAPELSDKICVMPTALRRATLYAAYCEPTHSLGKRVSTCTGMSSCCSACMSAARKCNTATQNSP